jgi:hypothetical protein
VNDGVVVRLGVEFTDDETGDWGDCFWKIEKGIIGDYKLKIKKVFWCKETINKKNKIK